MSILTRTSFTILDEGEEEGYCPQKNGLDMILLAVVQARVPVTTLDLCAVSFGSGFVSALPFGHTRSSMAMRNVQTLCLRDAFTHWEDRDQRHPILSVTQDNFPALRHLAVHGDFSAYHEFLPPLLRQSDIPKLESLTVQAHQIDRLDYLLEFIERYGEGVPKLAIEDFRGDWTTLLTYIEKIRPQELTIYYDDRMVDLEQRTNGTRRIRLVVEEMNEQALLNATDTVILSSDGNSLREDVQKHWGNAVQVVWKKELRRYIVPAKLYEYNFDPEMYGLD
ncbi:hypothetical protein BU23DRAFT_632297 [Bimuria novae-zelandiae CBS 107.79]|uniref:Uncharacterized protein n=1 Tax=Bimuria novae-zelandiae CBS 107.79 TaxID=1447943 RepID=A0A6A5VF25_9PLEO|nr:hypothetical protein BU23DRAFT_632297 [Bimuria novae-zelandiae CBS 107.79]